MVKVIKSCVLEHFRTYLLLMQKKISLRSSNLWKALVKPSLVRVLMALSHFILNLSKDKVRPAGCLFSMWSRRVSRDKVRGGVELGAEPDRTLLAKNSCYSGRPEPVEKLMPRHQVRPFLLKNPKELPQSTNYVFCINCGASRHMVGVQYTTLLFSKKARTVCFICFFQTLFFVEPGLPFLSHCFDGNLFLECA